MCAPNFFNSRREKDSASQKTTGIAAKTLRGIASRCRPGPAPAGRHRAAVFTRDQNGISSSAISFAVGGVTDCAPTGAPPDADDAGGALPDDDVGGAISGSLSGAGSG